jgi:mannan polymerase II complex ANP1 subunit
MGFEVVGLPHYVVWHVYEPSEDDLRRMEEMAKEREVKEHDVEDIELSRARWDQDRKIIDAVLERKKAEKAWAGINNQNTENRKAVIGGEEGPVAHIGEEGVHSGGGNGLTEIERGKVGSRDEHVHVPVKQ